MIAQIEALIAEVEQATAPDKDALEAYRLRFLAKKGIINDLFEAFKDVPPAEKRQVGQLLNQLKNAATERLKEMTAQLEHSMAGQVQPRFDLTLPVQPDQQGARHPLMHVREKIIQVFERIGFTVADGPEIESDWYNFGALNFPDNHPAREMQDTFFLERHPDVLLRTHTSNVQIRLMEQQGAPVRAIMPGRVYRNETISARAHCLFHQVEGLFVDENVSFADMKNTLYYFAKEMFGSETKIRLRPSYFPFTEPSAEMDVTCMVCGGKGCNVCKHTGWVEIMGCGMVDPNVLANCGIDPEKYTGFAFGMGIERIAMLLYRMNDLRLFTTNDVRFLRQFTPLS